MRLHTLHRGAALAAEQSLEIVVAALDRALKDGADIGAGAGGHVVVCQIRGSAAWGAQAAGEAAGQIEKRLGNIEAVVAERVPALFDGLRHKLVLRILKQILKVDKML